MLPAIWNENNQTSNEAKPVTLRLIPDFTGETYLSAVDDQGNEVATLLKFTAAAGVVPASDAKESLENSGYDTTFTKWNSEGAMKLNHSTSF